MPSSELSHISALLEAIPLGAFVVRLEDRELASSLRIVFANSMSEKLLGLPTTTFVGTLTSESFPVRGDQEAYAEDARRAIVEEKLYHLGVISYRATGADERRFSASIFPLGDDYAVILFDNLSVSSSSSTELSAIVSGTYDAVVSTTFEGEILSWNDAAERLFGFSADEMIGRPGRSLHIERISVEGLELDEVRELLRRGETVRNFEVRVERKDGSSVDVLFTVSPVIDRHGTTIGAAAVGRDIGQHRDDERRLQEFAAIEASSFDAIVATNRDGIIKTWNAASEELFGYTRDEIIGKPVTWLNLRPTVEGGPHLNEIRRRLLRGSSTKPFDARATRKDGSELEISVAASRIVNADGVTVGFASLVRDSTERRQLEHQARQIQKMEAIGTLTGGVAHDFNNMLQVIMGYSAKLALRIDDESLLEDLSRIEQATARGAEFTRKLLAFSRQQVLRPEMLSLNEVIETELNFLALMIGEDVDVVTQFDSRLENFAFDRGQLEQVILNLAINARDAMPTGGILRLRTSRVEFDQSGATAHGCAKAGPYAVVHVADSGTGMDRETQRQIFDPFFTTKPLGTGLGLATVYGIVTQSGGHVEVQSEPRVGTTFTLYLPLASIEVIAPATSTALQFPLEGHETILLVEDVDAVRELVAMTLEGYGYVVVQASNGAEAIDAVRDYPDSINLLLTDVVMPVMNGRELAENLVRVNPTLKVLFTSGYPADTLLRHGIAEASTSFIEKPYRADELARAVRTVLDSADGENV